MFTDCLSDVLLRDTWEGLFPERDEGLRCSGVSYLFYVPRAVL